MMKINSVKLDFEQRQRAVALENHVALNEYATAAEIIWLRDRVKFLEEDGEHPCLPDCKFKGIRHKHVVGVVSYSPPPK